ncbi:MAG TPA: NAD-dependent epimerase/dehydratase family protein [Marmoricola sp.]|jgi:nucleoside-diphosphate-sugar epimerase|nr:NAD-dependent epimerase/dehydratase family protein [Marmoricola sp.]
MRLLVLGGTQHVGRAVVETALARGDEVTTVNRGSTPAPPGVDARTADRRTPGALLAALGTDAWDAVLDTWSHEPAAVADAARLLDGRAGHYTYISSRSVHRWPIPGGADESAPVVDADPASTIAEDYAEAKRGGELAVEAGFSGGVLLARAGLILGPYEVVGRLPWWLNRIAAGGRVVAPGPSDRPLQYVDARDLAAWVLHCADDAITGAFNAVSPPGHTTIGELLEQCVVATGSDADLVSVSAEVIEAAGVSGWTDLPIWAPPTGEIAALHDGDTTAAVVAGLRCRPVAETVADTWAWLQAEGTPEPPSGRAGTLGISAATEAALLEAATGS